MSQNLVGSICSVLARISKGQGATSEKGTFMRKRWLKKGRVRTGHGILEKSWIFICKIKAFKSHGKLYFIEKSLNSHGKLLFEL
jgi:hypothetical protein